MAVVAAALLAAGCGTSSESTSSSGGSSGSTSGTATSGGSGSSTTVAAKGAAGSCGVMPAYKAPADPDGVLATLPTTVHAAYDHYADTVRRSAFANFTPKHKAPWVVGFSESYEGNTWRHQLDTQLRADFAGAQSRGLVSKLLFQNSNNNNAVQIQQIRSMIQQGADVIITVAGSSTALNGVIADAYRAGIPVITVNSGVTSPYAINLDLNYALHSIIMANGLVNAIGRKGNIITVQGLSGAPGSVAYEAAEKPIIAACPNVKVVANIYGQWANPIAKTQMQTALATHPQQIDGIYQQGNMGQGIIQALQQSGRSTGVAITEDAPNASLLAFWRANASRGFRAIGVWSPPAASVDAGFQIAMRVMQGNGLRINTVLPPNPVIDSSNYQQYLRPGWTFNTDLTAEPTKGTYLDSDYLDNFFTRPGAVEYGGPNN